SLVWLNSADISRRPWFAELKYRWLIYWEGNAPLLRLTSLRRDSMRNRPICRARLLFWSGLLALSAISLGCARNVERVPPPREAPLHAHTETTDQVASGDDKTKPVDALPGQKGAEELRRLADGDRDDRTRERRSGDAPAPRADPAPAA